MALQFTGPFAPMCEQFVAERREAGRDYSQQEKILRMFDNFSKDYAVEPFVISEELAQAGVKSVPMKRISTGIIVSWKCSDFPNTLSSRGIPLS